MDTSKNIFVKNNFIFGVLKIVNLNAPVKSCPNFNAAYEVAKPINKVEKSVTNPLIVFCWQYNYFNPGKFTKYWEATAFHDENVVTQPQIPTVYEM